MRTGWYTNGTMQSSADGFLGPLVTNAQRSDDYTSLHNMLNVLRASPAMLFSKYASVLERRERSFPVVGPNVLPAISNSQARAVTQPIGFRV